MIQQSEPHWLHTWRWEQQYKKAQRNRRRRMEIAGVLAVAIAFALIVGAVL